MIPRLNPTLIAPTDCIPHIQGPILVIICPLEPFPLILFKQGWLLPAHSSAMPFLLQSSANCLPATPLFLFKPLWTSAHRTSRVKELEVTHYTSSLRRRAFKRAWAPQCPFF